MVVLVLLRHVQLFVEIINTLILVRVVVLRVRQTIRIVEQPLHHMRGLQVVR